MTLKRPCSTSYGPRDQGNASASNAARPLLELAGLHDRPCIRCLRTALLPWSKVSAIQMAPGSCAWCRFSPAGWWQSAGSSSSTGCAVVCDLRLKRFCFEGEIAGTEREMKLGAHRFGTTKLLSLRSGKERWLSCRSEERRV